MKKIDKKVKQAFIERFGRAPKYIGYIVQNANGWLFFLSAIGGLTGLFLQKHWIIGIYEGRLNFIKVNQWKRDILQEEKMTINTADIQKHTTQQVRFRHHFKLKMKDGNIFNFMMYQTNSILYGHANCLEEMEQLFQS